jgi:hypothetical protein
MCGIWVMGKFLCSLRSIELSHHLQLVMLLFFLFPRRSLKNEFISIGTTLDEGF